MQTLRRLLPAPRARDDLSDPQERAAVWARLERISGDAVELAERARGWDQGRNEQTDR